MIHRHGSFRLPTSDWWWTFDYRRIIVSILYDACMATAWIAIFEQEYPVGWVNPFSNNQSMHALMAYDFQIWYGRNWESREWKISMYSYCMMPLALFTEKKSFSPKSVLATPIQPSSHIVPFFIIQNAGDSFKIDACNIITLPQFAKISW